MIDDCPNCHEDSLVRRPTVGFSNGDPVLITIEECRAGCGYWRTSSLQGCPPPEAPRESTKENEG